MVDNGMIMITLEEYKGLLKDRAILDALIRNGVYHWEFFGLAFDEKYKDEVKEIREME